MVIGNTRRPVPPMGWRILRSGSTVWVLVGLVVMPVGCDRGRSGTAPRSATTQSANDGSLPASPSGPQRIISLAPNVTEILFALGQGHRLVGVSSYCTYPPEATRLPKCGGVMDTDLEKILTLRPDAIIIVGRHETVAQFCGRNDIPLVRISPNDMMELYDAIRTIGRAVGCPAEAERLVGKIKTDIERVRSAVKDRRPIKAFLSISRSPDRLKSPMTTNGAGFLSQMLEAAGGINIFAGTDVPYPTIAVGEIIRRQPEVIFELQPGQQPSEAQRHRMIGQWAELGSIPAVTHHRVYFITEDFATILGPRVPLLAKRFAELLHPDLVGKLH